VPAGTVAAEVIDVTPTENEKDPTAANSLVLTGRLALAPELRRLPSGDELVTFRLVVPRPARAPGHPPGTDWFNCAVWGGRVRAHARHWAAGDVVRVEGALRRRYFTTPAGRQSRVEVEVLGGRRLARAGAEGAGTDRRQSGRAASE
jgi:single-strand DNA-binding protein